MPALIFFFFLVKKEQGVHCMYVCVCVHARYCILSLKLEAQDVNKLIVLSMFCSFVTSCIFFLLFFFFFLVFHYIVKGGGGGGRRVKKKKKDLMAVSIWLYLVSESVLTTDFFYFFSSWHYLLKKPRSNRKAGFTPSFLREVY